MPKGDKYIGLTNYLKDKTVSSIIMSFSEIEKQIGDTLLDSAYKYREFWSNTCTHSVAFGWLEAGYKTISVDFENIIHKVKTLSKIELLIIHYMGMKVCEDLIEKVVWKSLRAYHSEEGSIGEF